MYETVKDIACKLFNFEATFFNDHVHVRFPAFSMHRVDYKEGSCNLYWRKDGTCGRQIKEGQNYEQTREIYLVRVEWQKETSFTAECNVYDIVASAVMDYVRQNPQVRRNAEIEYIREQIETEKKVIVQYEAGIVTANANIEALIDQLTELHKTMPE